MPDLIFVLVRKRDGREFVVVTQQMFVDQEVQGSLLVRLDWYRLAHHRTHALVCRRRLTFCEDN